MLKYKLIIWQFRFCFGAVIGQLAFLHGQELLILQYPWASAPVAMANKPVKYEWGIWVPSVNGEFPEDEYGHIGVKSTMEVILIEDLMSEMRVFYLL